MFVVVVIKIEAPVEIIVDGLIVLVVVIVMAVEVTAVAIIYI